MDRKKIIRIVVFWGPVVAWMAVIFCFSAQPQGSPALEHFPAPAGIGHFVGYAVLGFLLYRAFNQGLKGWSLRAAGLTILVGFLYAVSDELHQLFVPGREAALYDLFIDTVAVMVVLLIIYVSRFLIPGRFNKGNWKRIFKI